MTKLSLAGNHLRLVTDLTVEHDTCSEHKRRLPSTNFTEPHSMVALTR